MIKNSKSKLLVVIGLILGWRLLLFFVSIIAPLLIKYHPSFPYALELLPEYGLPQWIYSWANFDGVHYLTIAEKGYIGTGLIQAFFPTYPLLVIFVNQVIGNTILSGLLISNIGLLLLGVIFFKLVAKHYSDKVAWFALVSWLLFPTSFYFGAVYSESIFLCLVIGTFYASSLRQWWLAGLLAALASATRVVGVFLVPALLWEALNVSLLIDRAIRSQKQGVVKKLSKFSKLLWCEVCGHKKAIIAVMIGLSGLICYMIFLWGEFDDPFYFFHVQAEFGAGRQEQLILLPQTLWRGLKILMTVPISFAWMTYAQEFFLTIVALFIIGWLWWQEQRIKHAWLIFTTLAILLPTVTGSLSSMPRYLLAAFPIFIWLGLKINEQIHWRWTWLISGILLIINTVLFIQGVWIA